MKDKTSAVLLGLVLLFLALAGLFLLDSWGHPKPLYPIALVDPHLLAPTTIRKSYAALLRDKEDVSDFDCYACHEQDKPINLKFDTNQNPIIPTEHSSIVMAHGRHNRNNNCFNCHNEQNLQLLQTRDGREVKLVDSPALCGSCHGPTYRDWEAGAHGRTGGYWNTASGPLVRQLCVDCHNPHHPKIPPRQPFPAPNPLRQVVHAAAEPAH